MLWWPDKLLITGHEGDLLHMADAALRMAYGELPHLDFMTPIGILGFAPVAGFLVLGFPVGKATLLAGAAMLAIMLPVIWWLAATRLSRGQAYFFAAVMVVTMMAVVYGGDQSTISLSMYYNRWGWSIAFLLLVTILFPPQRIIGEGWIAPLVVGLSMVALAMLKVTFFAPLLPAVVMILLVQKQGGLLLKALFVGLITAAGLLLWLGWGFFQAYLLDLLVVTRPSSARVNAGVNIAESVGAPGSIATTLILFASLVIFRRSERRQQGLVVMILAPVFTYMTYQNWGNDPKWLLLLVLYIWANLPDIGAKPVFGLAARQAAIVSGVAALTVIAPSVVSMATSPWRAALKANADGFAKLELNGGVSDIWLPERQAHAVVILRALEGWPALAPDVDPVVINGFAFPDCVANGLLVAQYEGMAAQIEAQEVARGRPVLVADVLNSVWLMADVGRVHGAAPWYYGDDSGLVEAAFLAVPICPIKLSLRARLVNVAQSSGYTLNELSRTDLMVLYALTKPAE